MRRGGGPAPPASFPEFLAHSRASGLPPSILLCILLWLALSAYWSWAARSKSEARSSEGVLSRQFHMLLVSAAQLLVFLPVPGLRMRILPDAPWGGIVGVGLCLAGLAFSVAARRALGRNWSGEVTTKVGHTLVTGGPYALVRHPIYTGVFGLYIGTAVASGELHALVGVVLAAIAYARKVPMEEKVLAAEFGDAWTDYRARTKAIIPFAF